MRRDFEGYFAEYDEGERPEALSVTQRELEVLFYVSHGLQGPEIAEALNISPLTVETHTAHIRRNLAAKTMAHAVAIALRLGLID